jgi:poly(A) polymerase
VESLIASLEASPIAFQFASFSALDRYFSLRESSLVFIDTEATQADLARTLDGVSYPGIEYGDALVVSEGRKYYFRCVDSLTAPHPCSYGPLTLRYDPRRRVYLDKSGIYGMLRKKEPLGQPRGEPFRALFEAASLSSRYGLEAPEGGEPLRAGEVPAEVQADLLTLVLTGRRPETGLTLLLEKGFIERFWPELSAMDSIGQSKEFHPEGNAWAHTLETFRYRKVPDLTLSLGLLLHDIGKARAVSNEGRRFDGHAEIGVPGARRFLERLGFSSGLANDVSFLIRNHMIPAALPELPFYRVKECIESPLFPTLLELYRCDLMSTYRGPEGYYAACKTYKAYLKNVKNPFRGPDGKKDLRLFVE